MDISRRGLIAGLGVAAASAFAGTAMAKEQTAAMVGTRFLGRPYITTDEARHAKDDILDLLSFERFSRDNALWEAMHECYSDDSIVTISWYKGDGHGFVDASAANPSYAPHKIYNSVTYLNDACDKGVTFMMATCEMRAPIQGVECEVAFDTCLIFRTKKVDGQWYIAAFDSIYNKDSLKPVLPSNQVDVTAADTEEFRSSYKALSYYLSQLGGQCDQELLGRDEPETLVLFYAELEAWLAE